MITFVAIPFQVFHITRSSLAVGAVGLVELVGLLSFAFLGGTLADAVDRRGLVLATEAALAACAACLVLNARLSRPRLWPLFAIAGLMASLGALQRPAMEALVPRLVDPHELGAAGAIQSFEGTMAMIAGPALAGVVIAAAGLPVAFGVDVATFVFSLVALVAMAGVPPPPDATRPSLRRVAEGLAYARSRPELLGTYLVDLFAMFFGMPMALFPAIATRYGGAGVLGLLYAAPSVGALLATCDQRLDGACPPARPGHTSGRRGVGRRHRGVRSGCTVVAGRWSALVAAGAADMVSGLFRMILWNRTIPDSLRGRLASVELVSYTAGPLLGNAEAGMAASVIGVGPSVVLGGGLCVLAVAATAALLPTLRAYDDR